MPQEAFEAELSMLQSMYPEEVGWSSKNAELTYGPNGSSSSFTLRIPDDYPGTALPEVVIATVHKMDVRDQLQKHVKGCEAEVPMIDIVIDVFRAIIDEVGSRDSGHDQDESSRRASDREDHLTVIIWLHHLLNTAKRKQVTSPATHGVSGVSKPGYPGVLVFSGRSSAVSQHVEELKALRWQGFQVRLEVAKRWTFQHGEGVLEVESMSDVVAQVGEDKKQDLLAAVMRQ